MLSKSKILEIIYNALIIEKDIKKNNLDDILKSWKIKTNNQCCSLEENLINLCAMLQEDIRQENNKNNGKANVAKAMNNIIKNAIKINKYKKEFHGAIIKDGCQYVTDAYRIIKLYNPIDIQEAPEQNTFDFEKLLKGARENQEELKTPTISELKTHIEIEKVKDKNNTKIYYDFGENKPMVDAKYLLDILTAFPDAKIYANGVMGILYFKDELGEAILCPIRKQQ